MQPSRTAISLTTASGAGCGLLVLLGVFSAGKSLPVGPCFAAAAFGLALGALAFGLVSALAGSDLPGWAHGRRRPGRFPRTVLLAALTCVPAVPFAFGWIVLGRTDGPWRALALATTLLAGLTVYANAIACAGLRPTRGWSDRWVVPGYLALALLVGALWLNALAYLFGRPSPDLAMVVVIAVFLAFYLKRRYWRAIDAAPAPAGGPGAAPPAGPIEAERVRRHRRSAFLGLFAAPLLLSMAAIDAAPAVAIAETVAAALGASAGLIVERRLFLAEAQGGATLRAADGAA